MSAVRSSGPTRQKPGSRGHPAPDPRGSGPWYLGPYLRASCLPPVRAENVIRVLTQPARTRDETLEIGDHLTIIGGGFDLARIGSVTLTDPPRVAAAPPRRP